MPMKIKPKLPRNKYAIAAQFRNSAGAMKDRKKESCVTACRDYDYRTDDDDDDFFWNLVDQEDFVKKVKE